MTMYICQHCGTEQTAAQLRPVALLNVVEESCGRCGGAVEAVPTIERPNPWEKLERGLDRIVEERGYRLESNGLRVTLRELDGTIRDVTEAFKVPSDYTFSGVPIGSIGQCPPVPSGAWQNHCQYAGAADDWRLATADDIAAELLRVFGRPLGDPGDESCYTAVSRSPGGERAAQTLPAMSETARGQG